MIKLHLVTESRTCTCGLEKSAAINNGCCLETETIEVSDYDSLKRLIRDFSHHATSLELAQLNIETDTDDADTWVYTDTDTICWTGEAYKQYLHLVPEQSQEVKEIWQRAIKLIS